jgi:putative transcriptional regulator
VSDGIFESLETPLFLVAMPQVGDPFFHRGVVLLLEHSPQGSFGLVVNRLTELPLAAVLGELGLAWESSRHAFAYFGGPVHPNVGTALFSGVQVDEEEERTLSVGADVRLSQDIRVLSQIAPSPPEAFRLILGSAGWTGGQLEAELGRNDWLIAPFDRELLFWEASHEIWPRALASIGVRPESLSSMSGHEDDGIAN